MCKRLVGPYAPISFHGVLASKPTSAAIPRIAEDLQQGLRGHVTYASNENELRQSVHLY